MDGTQLILRAQRGSPAPCTAIVMLFILLNRRVFMRCLLRTSVFALTASLAACGTEDASPVAESSSNALARIDPCTLLTPEEIVTHIGSAPGAPESAMFGAIPTCTWPAADDSESQILHVSVARRATADYESFLAEQQEAWGEDYSAGEYELIDAGDFAVRQDAAMFFVFTGDYQLNFAGSLRDGLPSSEACKELGQIAVSRLR